MEPGVAVIPCSTRRSQTAWNCHFFCFLGGETTPSAASFEDVACPVRYGIEVKVWHTMNPERHTRDALGDDLVLLRVSDPCHAE